MMLVCAYWSVGCWWVNDVSDYWSVGCWWVNDVSDYWCVGCWWVNDVSLCLLECWMLVGE